MTGPSPKLYAVIGQPISHSLSPEIHEAFARQLGIDDLHYRKIEGHKEHFEQQVMDFFAQGGQGMNVTLPFKERAYAMADRPSEFVKAAKAANTLWMSNGQLQAENTDGPGLVADLQRHVPLKGASILLLGAGGAARGAILPLLEAQPKRLTLSNRTFEKAQALKKDFPCLDICPFDELSPSFDLIINATSMSYTADPVTFVLRPFLNQPFCYDMAYSITQATPFMAFAQEQGCRAVDGLGMLVEQAARSFEIWHGQRPDVLPVLKGLRRK